MATNPESVDNASTTDRRVAGRQLALAIGGVLLLFLLVWFFFLRSDSQDSSATKAPEPVEEVIEEEEGEVDSPGRNRPVETFEVFAPKDPFDPLVSASTAGTGTATQTTGDTTGTDTGTTSTISDGTGTTTTTDGTGTTTSSGDGGGSDGTSSVGAHRVRVIDVFEEGGRRRAQVQVDGTVYTVDEGERFADNFQLMSTSGRCATMLFGDDEFTLCEGEEILK